MFCKNCGKPLNEGDLFCGECGTPVSGQDMNNADVYKESAKHTKSEKTYRVEVQVPEFNLDGCQIVKLAKMYFFKPVSFFSEFKECDNLKTAAAVAVLLPIIYAVMSLIYTMTMISGFFSGIKKIPEFLAKAGIMSFSEAMHAQAEISTSEQFYEFKASFKNMIDYKKIFGDSFIQLIAVIIITFIIVEIINAVFMKNRIKTSNVFFAAACSFTPLVLSCAVAALVNFASILCGCMIVLFGYVLSFITLYYGVKQLSDETDDKIFGILVILFIIISILVTVVVTKKVESSLLQIKNIFSSVEGII